jgi:cytoskeletal protein CcmA (bactofilin family)
MVWKKPEEETHSARPPMGTTSEPAGQATRPVAATGVPGVAVIGSSLVIKGEVSGNEDVVIHGQIDGKFTLNKHSVVVGREGRVKADIYAKSIRVEGQVNGNLFGEGEVVIHKTGQVRGNITAPQVSLENGSKFKGAIDMEPGDAGGSVDVKAEARSKEAPVAASAPASSPTAAGLPATSPTSANKEAVTASSRN